MKTENLLTKLVDYFIMDCISYTIVVFLLAVLSAAKIVQNMDYSVLLQLLLCTTVISFVLFVANCFLPDSRWRELIVGLVNGFLVVLVIGGGIFHWFPWSYQYVIMVLVIFAVSYLISYGIRLFDNKVMSDKINQIIKEKRK